MMNNKSFEKFLHKTDVTKAELVEFFMLIRNDSITTTNKWFSKKNKLFDNASPNRLIKDGKILIVRDLLCDMAVGNPT